MTGVQTCALPIFSDTGLRKNSRHPFLWELRPEHEAAVAQALTEQFGAPPENNLAEQLESIAAQLVSEYWVEHKQDILDIVDGSFLEGYDEFNIGVQFRNAATVSITYSLLSRCCLLYTSCPAAGTSFLPKERPSPIRAGKPISGKRQTRRKKASCRTD